MAAQQLKNGDQSDPSLITAFLNAYAKLSSKLAPVTAETVRASNEQIGSPVRNSGVWAIATLVIVVLLSLLVSVTNTIGKDITDGIAKANAIAATARYYVGAPKIGNDADWRCGEAKAAPDPPIEYRAPFTEQDLITELQTFAASIRDIHSSTLKLNFFVINIETNPLNPFNPPNPSDPKLTPVGLPDEALQLSPSLNNFRAAVLCKITAYQYVRSFAQCDC